MATFKEDFAKEQENPFPNYRDVPRLLYIDVSRQFILFEYEQKKYPEDWYRQAELLVNMREFVSIVLHGQNNKSYPQAS
jgi:hypothetical protein